MYFSNTSPSQEKTPPSPYLKSPINLHTILSTIVLSPQPSPNPVVPTTPNPLITAPHDDPLIRQLGAHPLPVLLQMCRLPLTAPNTGAQNNSSPQTAQTDPARLPHPLEAPKQVEKGLAKAAVHETVRDRVAAAGRVGEQLEKANACVGEVLVQDFRHAEHGHGVDDIQRRPAYKELDDDHGQHLNHALLVQ